MTKKKEGFLEILARERGKRSDAGDQYGGASGADGSGLPQTSPRNFMFATGVECSYPTIGKGRIRRDLLAECGHYTHWQRDLRLVHDLGLKVLRYGLPYHTVHRGIGQYDWSFTDEVMHEIRRLGITPILDLLHFGVPDWLGDFQNPELPLRFAEYAAAVAKRYPWVRCWTPVNEIYICARSSAKDGLWNEQLKSERGFVTAIKHLVAANTLACHAIARRRPDAIIVQSESAEYVHEATAQKSPRIALENKLRFLSLDLLYAHPPDADVMLYLQEHGLTRAEYDWNMRGEPPGYQVMGNDYYGRNEKIILPDGSECPGEDVLGWYQITRQYYERYRKPVMHTETNHFDPDMAPRWLWKQWINVMRMRADGVPVLGFTWYSLTDQIDWDTALAEQNGTVNACGLYDLNRQPRPVAAAYRQLLEAFGQITMLPHGEIFEITELPALLKVKCEAAIGWLGREARMTPVEPALMVRTAAKLFTAGALVGTAMAIRRFATDRSSPVALVKLHGALNVSGLALLVYGWATVGLPTVASIALALLLCAAAGGVVTGQAWRWKRFVSVETVLFLHLSVAALGLFLLLAASMGPG